MQSHFPIDAGVSFDCGQGDLLGFDWQNRSADFLIPDDQQHVLRVKFGSEVIVRMLDEMPLSIESDASTWQGMVPHHFAYRVQGAPFAENQPESWVQVFGPMNHFRFVTGWGCLDVLTQSEPEFALVPTLR
jgi:hypothetical protein